MTESKHLYLIQPKSTASYGTIPGGENEINFFYWVILLHFFPEKNYISTKKEVAVLVVGNLRTSMFIYFHRI